MLIFSRPTRRYAGQPNIYDTSNGFSSHTFPSKPFALHLDTDPSQSPWRNYAPVQPSNHVSADEWLSSPVEKESLSAKRNRTSLQIQAPVPAVESDAVHEDVKQQPEFALSPAGIDYVVPLDGMDYHPDHPDYFLSRSNSYTLPSDSLTMAPNINGIGDMGDLGFHPPLFDTKPTPPPLPTPSGSCFPIEKHTVSEEEVILTAQDHWSCFKCNPSPEEPAPETANAHLNKFVEILMSQDVWDSLDVQQAESHLAMNKTISTEPVLRSVRDRLLEYTRQLFRTALESRLPSSPRARSPIEDELESMANQTEQLVLPPPHVLRYFLRAFVCGFEPFYPTVARGMLNPDILLDEKCPNSSLLLLLLFAQGAMTDPTIEARTFSSGLTEICRIALNQAMEREVFVIKVEPAFMRNALHYLNLAAWGGDKWHTDVAIGQRGIYTHMLQLSGMLDYRDDVVTTSGASWDIDKMWDSWTVQESRSRLVYSWVNVDQEVSLFYDTTPYLSVSNMHIAMPSPDSLWQSTSANDWHSLYEKYGPTAQLGGLNDLFKQFMEDGLLHQAPNLSAIHLRLLLHPLQGLCSHLGQFLQFFSNNSPVATSRLVTSSASRSQLDEVRYLLQQWYVLYTNSSVSCSQDPAVSTALVMYHLMSLGTRVNLPEIEEFLRQTPLTEPFRRNFNLKMRSMEYAEELFFHCGQVLRLLCLLRRSSRPIWWPAAIYRVALICFITSAARLGHQFGTAAPPTGTDEPAVSLNTLPPDDPTVTHYLRAREGTAVITRRNGNLAALDSPDTVLRHCVDVLDEDLATRLAEGIRNRLARLLERWLSPNQHIGAKAMYTNESEDLGFC
ncbi:MAG: hypothetical protein M1821_007854 [Bathelium mastoideum]|nr:MAG: hypothetical protein M1821_007854 [Bathelium mastoideum]